eukprot:403360757
MLVIEKAKESNLKSPYYKTNTKFCTSINIERNDEKNNSEYQSIMKRSMNEFNTLYSERSLKTHNKYMYDFMNDPERLIQRLKSNSPHQYTSFSDFNQVLFVLRWNEASKIKLEVKTDAWQNYGSLNNSFNEGHAQGGKQKQIESQEMYNIRFPMINQGKDKSNSTQPQISSIEDINQLLQKINLQSTDPNEIPVFESIKDTNFLESIAKQITREYRHESLLGNEILTQNHDTESQNMLYGSQPTSQNDQRSINQLELQQQSKSELKQLIIQPRDNKRSLHYAKSLQDLQTKLSLQSRKNDSTFLKNSIREQPRIMMNQNQIKILDQLQEQGQIPIKSQVYNTPRELMQNQEYFLTKTINEVQAFERKQSIAQKLNSQRKSHSKLLTSKMLFENQHIQENMRSKDRLTLSRLCEKTQNHVNKSYLLKQVLNQSRNDQNSYLQPSLQQDPILNLNISQNMNYSQILLDIYNKDTQNKDQSLLIQRQYNKNFKNTFKYKPNRKIENIFKKDRKSSLSVLMKNKLQDTIDESNMFEEPEQVPNKEQDMAQNISSYQTLKQKQQKYLNYVIKNKNKQGKSQYIEALRYLRDQSEKQQVFNLENESNMKMRKTQISINKAISLDDLLKE